MFKLKDRTFLVTGGTTDVGWALCINLASLGADIAIIDKNPEKARRIIDEISASHEINDSSGKAAYIEADLSKPEAVKEAVSKAAETFGGVDVLVSGLNTSKVTPISSPDYLKEFERLIAVNLCSSVYVTQAVLPFMKGRKRGKIVYLLSDLVRYGSEFESLTAITRGGIVYYARALARELASSNIAVNCVAVGPTEDYLLNRDPEVSSIKEAEKKLLQTMPLARTMRADEISHTIAFLCSSMADAVTGQTWAVNGGLTML